jgi:hypothetical protein
MSVRINTTPHSAGKNQFWNHKGQYEKFKAREELLRKRYGLKKPRNEWLYMKADWRSADKMGWIPEYTEGVPYNHKQLEWMADKMIFTDLEYIPTGHILSRDMWKRRKRHEIYTDLGAPDPNIVEGLYWRTHPQGIPWRTSEEMRADGGQSFYKD